ncbi:MAG: dihydroorotate dehydrogenase-like protein [Acidimicrobiia bacterium]
MTDTTSGRPDLTTRYLGFELRSPLVASASPLTGSVEGLQRLADAGAAALVMPSLFEEQLVHDQVQIQAYLDTGAESFGEAQTVVPELIDYNTGPERYLGVLAEARERVSVPLIASLNGTTLGGWARYAHQCEQAGADALELNVYLLASDPSESAAVVEDRYVELVETVVSSVGIPVAVKLAPYFTSFGHLARRLADAGAQALVLFNRFTRLDVELEKLEIELPIDLSTPAALGLPLRWTGILFGEVDAELAVSGGVHSGCDAAKALLVGADVAMMTSAVLQRGESAFAEVEDELSTWLTENDYESVAQLRGSMSRARVPDPSVYARANYLRSLIHYAGRYRPTPT